MSRIPRLLPPIPMFPTPRVIVNYEKLVHNIKHMQSIANKSNIRLSPHVKTHKCISIAKSQVANGAYSFTCSKPYEAYMFMPMVDRITIACPIMNPIIIADLLKQSIKNKCQLTFIVDNMVGVHVLQKAIDNIIDISSNDNSNEQFIIPIIHVKIKIDTGLHRCGIEPINTTSILDIIKEIATTTRTKNKTQQSFLQFNGILSHAGHAYSASNINEVQEIAEKERIDMIKVKDSILNSNLTGITSSEMCEISVGSTLTELCRENFTGIDEIRPGNYVFMDLMQYKLGLLTSSSSVLNQISLTIIATVISENDHCWIIDCGSKTLSSDVGAHGGTAFTGLTTTKSYGLAFPSNCFDKLYYKTLNKDKNNKSFNCSEENELLTNDGLTISKLSEEHGWISKSQIQNGSSSLLSVGEFVRIIPNHSCPVMNLASFFEMEKQNNKDGTTTSNIEVVDARGSNYIPENYPIVT